MKKIGSAAAAGQPVASAEDRTAGEVGNRPFVEALTKYEAAREALNTLVLAIPSTVSGWSRAAYDLRDFINAAESEAIRRDYTLDPRDLLVGCFPTPGPGMHVGMPKGVRIEHVPTGAVSICDSERSQPLNREKALRDLTATVAALVANGMLASRARREPKSKGCNPDACDASPSQLATTPEKQP